MPLTRPVAGDPVLVEDFGQPVYDKVVFGEGYAFGNLQTTSLAVGGQQYIVPFINRVTGDSLAWDITQANGTFVCKRAGTYFCICTTILGNFGAAAGGTYYGIGVQVNSIDRMNLVGGIAKYWDSSVNSCMLNLVANDVIRISAGTDSAGITLDARSAISLVPVKG